MLALMSELDPSNRWTSRITAFDGAQAIPTTMERTEASHIFQVQLDGLLDTYVTGIETSPNVGNDIIRSIHLYCESRYEVITLKKVTSYESGDYQCGSIIVEQLLPQGRYIESFQHYFLGFPAIQGDGIVRRFDNNRDNLRSDVEAITPLLESLAEGRPVPPAQLPPPAEFWPNTVADNELPGLNNQPIHPEEVRDLFSYIKALRIQGCLRAISSVQHFILKGCIDSECKLEEF